MKHLYPILFLLLIGCVNVSAQDVFSMQSKTKGFSAGVHLGLVSYANDILHAEPEGGAGFGLELQYGFSHQFAVALAFQNFAVATKSLENGSYNTSIESPYPYTEIDLIGKYIFGSTNSKLRPNLSLGLNYTRSKETWYYPDFFATIVETYSGYGFCGGGGLRYFLNTQMSLDFSFLVTSGDFTTSLANGTEFDFEHWYLSYKGMVGFMYHF